MPTKMKRKMISITPEMDAVIRKIKATPEFCMKPVSEVIRYLLELGAEKRREGKKEIKRK